MRVIAEEGRVVWSASDLKAAAECEFAWLRELDARLGRVSAVVEPEDAMLRRAITLGLAHEYRVLDDYRAAHGSAVVEIPETRSSDVAAVAAAVQATSAALAAPDVAVLYQGAFADADFIGFADFIVRTDDGWVVQDTKLARTARVTALMQLAAYVDQLHRLGVQTADRVELILGDGTVSTHLVRDVLPVFRLRRARIRALIADRAVAAGADHPPVVWGDPRGELDVRACGRCATCEEQVVSERDLLLVAGMRPVQRERLRAAGISTIDALAEASVRPPQMNADVFDSLRTQSALQLRTEAEAAPAPAYEVVAPKALGGLPRPDLGDMFFDFEGDPLYTEGADGRWGIDYLFGWVDMRESYTALWAHSFAEERDALVRFLEVVTAIRAAQPNMHIYHYAPYEPTHLAAMAARHGVGEAAVDRLLRDGVFVDLYPVVRRALRVGSRSYSIKKLEPLYMGDEVRTSDVQKGDVSIEQYVAARALREDGQDAEAQRLFDDLADYNRYDCVSTRRLRDWLVERARENGALPSRDVELDGATYEPSMRAEALRRRADDLASRRGDGAPAEDDEVALRLASAAIDYYPREAKTFWAAHFLRLREPVSVWADTRDVVVIDPETSRVREDWHSGAKAVRRVLELHGEFAPGTTIRDGSVQIVYDLPAPFPIETSPRWIHAARSARVITDGEAVDGGILVEETAFQGMTWDALPIAVTPGPPPMAGAQQGAIDGWADTLLAADGEFPSDAMTDLLRRHPPRTHGAELPPVIDGDRITAITRAVTDLDRSYLAVQGPPGTGKTYVGSHVIARLVAERGWRVGVVAQSHAVAENLLARIVDAGLAKDLVAKQPKDESDDDQPFTVVRRTKIKEWLEDHRVSGGVVGGTAWDFANTSRVDRGQLDLLVIDEAGQFSLASTIAVSVAAKRLLLLGDPQQLPQVSQGTHPEPVDTSALGWVMSDHDVLPDTHGYFLAESWRMHPAVARAVSDLSYEGKLRAHPSTSTRGIDGIEPGVHAVSVVHHGNATHSDEEAAEVVRIVSDLLGRTMTEGDGAPRPLTDDDVIVVTPYNAQQEVVAAALDAAGHGDIRVGTVDRFQGQEAAVSIVSMAASTARDAPRGLEFLLLQNRINVAISRAQVAAYVLSAPALLDDLPRTPDGVARLAAFARLVRATED